MTNHKLMQGQGGYHSDFSAQCLQIEQRRNNADDRLQTGTERLPKRTFGRAIADFGRGHHGMRARLSTHRIGLNSSGNSRSFMALTQQHHGH